MNNQNTAAVQKAYKDFAEGRHEEFFEFFTEDVEWCTHNVEGSYFDGNCRGRDAVREFFLKASEEATYEKFEPMEYITSGNQVVVIGEAIVKISATNREFNTEWVHIFTLKDFRVTRFREYFDTAEVARAFRKARTAGE